MVEEDMIRAAFDGCSEDVDVPYILFRVTNLLEHELGVPVTRSIERDIKRARLRKTKMFEPHMREFQGALLDEIEKDVLAPLTALIEAKIANDPARLEEMYTYFENLLGKRLTKENDAVTVSSDLPATVNS